MRILVDIGHPAHVHFYKNFIWEMGKRGHDIVVTARDKDVALGLLRGYNIAHKVIGKPGKGKLALVKEWMGREYGVLAVARKFHPEILTGIHNPCVAHVARLTGAKAIVFTDNDLNMMINAGIFPFVDVVCTPACFKKDLGRKQVRYNGYKELAHLHPDYFKPDSSVLADLGLKERERYIVLRFVAWKASHDIGHYGFDTQTKYELVNRLGEQVRIFITSEAALPADLEKYKIRIAPEKLHHLLYYATMVIGDCGTTAAEAGVLGTPAVRYNSFVGPRDLGFLAALEHKEGLIYSFNKFDLAMAKAEEILTGDNLRQEWAYRRRKMLADKIDVTRFMVNLIENYFS